MLAAWPAASSAAPAAAPPLPENLAAKAKVAASSEHSAAYLAKFAVDGKVPDAASHSDLSQAWAVKGPTAEGKGEFTLEWPQPVTVAEIVYYGRTAWEMQECLKDYEVYVDDATQPAARGQLQMVHGPQRIKLAGPTKVQRLRLKFLNSYGGSNPGASEIQVFAESPSEAALRAFAGQGPAIEESAELAAALAEGNLGFRQLLVIQRRPIDSTHVYTYHVEGFQAGGGLFAYTVGQPDPKQIFASPEGQILDADVSYDGQEILFSLRRGEKETYHVYSIRADGTGLRQLTEGRCHNYNACWLPDGGIALLSTRSTRFAYCWISPVGLLHRMDHDGSNVRRLSANIVNDFTPAVMEDGRILYSRWEYVDKPAIPIQSLWTINPDGTGLTGFYGNRVLSPATFMYGQAIPGTGRTLCILTAHNGPPAGRSASSIARSASTHKRRSATSRPRSISARSTRAMATTSAVRTKRLIRWMTATSLSPRTGRSSYAITPEPGVPSSSRPRAAWATTVQGRWGRARARRSLPRPCPRSPTRRAGPPCSCRTCTAASSPR